LPERKEPAAKRRKKGHLIPCPPSADSRSLCPVGVLLEMDGSCGTRPPAADSNSRSLRLPLALFPSISAMLGCGRWEEHMLPFRGNLRPPALREVLHLFSKRFFVHSIFFRSAL
jgi:hypothetical protein